MALWEYKLLFGAHGESDLPFQGSIREQSSSTPTQPRAYSLPAATGAGENNTVYQPLGDGVRVTASSTSGDSSRNVTLSNNIIWTQSGYDINVSRESQLGFKSNYNLLYTTGLGEIGYWQAPFGDLRDWQFDVDVDTQSVTGNPELVSPAGGDGALGYDATTGVDSGQDDNFHLQNGSPGVAAGDPASDYSKQPAPSGGRINLGAYGDTPQATTTAGVGVLVIEPGGSIQVAVGGVAASYSVALTSAPASNVNITLTTNNPLTLSTNVLTFTPADWSSPQAVMVKQITPPGLSGDYTVAIKQTVSSGDARYNALSIPNVIVQVANGGTTTTSPAPATLVVSGLTYTYDGNPHGATVIDQPRRTFRCVVDLR